MSLVVADTSPINYLLQTDLISILPRLYGEILIPTSVLLELTDQGSPFVVQNWANSLPGWVQVQSPLITAFATSKFLHRGELDAIALAEEVEAALLLIDDAAGVRLALARGLTITGTLGVLVEAAQVGHLDIEDALDKLQRTDFRATPSVFDRARMLARSIPPIPPRR
jgi:predicted nucleic acid-binding protein